VVRVLGYRSRGPGSTPGASLVFWEVVGLEWGLLSLMSTIEEILERKSSGSGLEIREYGFRDPSRWPRGTLFLQKLALTSLTTGSCSVSIVCSRTEATEFSLALVFLCYYSYDGLVFVTKGESTVWQVSQCRTSFIRLWYQQWIIHEIYTKILVSHRNFFCNPILFAICTSIFSRLCKKNMYTVACRRVLSSAPL
jgi:hypothetical protein